MSQVKVATVWSQYPHKNSSVTPQQKTSAEIKTAAFLQTLMNMERNLK